MANFTTDGKLCIEREIEIQSTDTQFEDLITRFDIIETCKWIKDNNFFTVNNSYINTLMITCIVYMNRKRIQREGRH